MKPIYMVHPRHGVHIAYDLAEVERCKQNGWTLRDETPVEEPQKKRGRPAKVE